MRRFLFLFLALVALAGCKDEEVIGGKSAPKTWTRAISLSPGTTELVMLHTKMQLVGRSESCNYPAQSKAVPVVLKGVKPDYERIQQLGGNVVIYDAQLFSEADIEPIKAMGMDVFAVKSDTYAGYLDDLYAIGRNSASELKISEYADLVQAAMGASKAMVGDTKPKVAILLPGSGSEHMIAGAKSFLADALTQMGAVPIGPDSPNFVTMNAEWLVAQNPDVIITADKPDAVFNDARLKGVNAIKNRRVGGILGDLLLRKGARMERLLRRMAEAIVGASN